MGRAGTCLSRQGGGPWDFDESSPTKVQRCLFRAGANFLPSHIWQTPTSLTGGGALVALLGMRAWILTPRGHISEWYSMLAPRTGRVSMRYRVWVTPRCPQSRGSPVS